MILLVDHRRDAGFPADGDGLAPRQRELLRDDVALQENPPLEGFQLVEEQYREIRRGRQSTKGLDDRPLNLLLLFGAHEPGEPVLGEIARDAGAARDDDVALVACPREPGLCRRVNHLRLVP